MLTVVTTKCSVPGESFFADLLMLSDKDLNLSISDAEQVALL